MSWVTCMHDERLTWNLLHIPVLLGVSSGMNYIVAGPHSSAFPPLHPVEESRNRLPFLQKQRKMAFREKL
jgi:hypothetical protein